MSEQNTADNWRLENTGDTLDQWKLQEAEQTQVSQWQLQGGQPANANWQPVEYERQPPRRGSWLLPFLVGLSLIAVFAYGVWIGLGTLGITDFASLFPTRQTTATPAAVGAAPQAQETSSAAPTETVAPTATNAPTETPVPTASPTPEPPKVEQQVVRITSPFGVNARRQPTTEAELIEILPQESEYLVIESRTDGWLQIALPSTELAWISSEFVESRSEQVLLEVANQRRAALNLPLLEAPVAQAQPTAESGAEPSATITETQSLAEAPSVTTTQSATATQPLTTVAAPSVTSGADGVVTGTVNIAAGLNARSAPTTTAPLVTLLSDGAVIPILDRSDDGQWLQTRLEEGTEVWVFAQYVNVSATAPSSSAPTTPITTTTTPITGTTGEPGFSASVKSLSGANIRLAPDRNASSFAVIPYDGVLTVKGRTANNEWLQVEYQGQTVWVLVSTVSLSADLTSLPVVTP